MGVVHDFIFEMFIWLAPLFTKQVTESWCFQLSILPTFNIVNPQKWWDPMDGPGVPWSAGRDWILSPTLKVCSLRFNMVQHDLGFRLGLGINGESNPKKVVTLWLADLWKPHLFMGVAAAILFNQRGGMVLQITNRQRRFRIREKTRCFRGLTTRHLLEPYSCGVTNPTCLPNLSSFRFRKFWYHFRLWSATCDAKSS